MEKGVKPRSTLTPEETAELSGYKQRFAEHKGKTLEDPIVSAGRLGIDYDRYHDLMTRSGVKIVVRDPAKDFFEL